MKSSKLLKIVFGLLLLVIIGEILTFFLLNKKNNSLVKKYNYLNPIDNNVLKNSPNLVYLNYFNDILNLADKKNTEIWLKFNGKLKEINNLGNNYYSFTVVNDNDIKIFGFLFKENSKIIKIFDKKNKLIGWQEVYKIKEKYYKEGVFFIKYNVGDNLIKEINIYIN